MGDCISWCNPVFKRVDTLPDVAVATRNHAYILPDNTIWILNEDGDGYLQMSTKNRDINIDSTDGSIVVTKEAEGNESNFNLKVAPDIINRINVLEGKTDKFVREVSVSKQGRQITLAYTYTDDTVKEVSFTDDDTIALLYDDTALVERIVALEGKLDNNTTYTIREGRLVGSDGSSVAIPSTRTILHGSTFYASPSDDFLERGGIIDSQPYVLFHENPDGSYDLTPLSEMYKKVERLLNGQLIVMGADDSVAVEPSNGVVYLKGYKVEFNDMEGKLVIIPPTGDTVDIPFPSYRVQDGKLIGSLGDEYDLPVGNQTTYIGDTDSVIANPLEHSRVMFSGYKISETGLVTRPNKTTFQLPLGGDTPQARIVKGDMSTINGGYWPTTSGTSYTYTLNKPHTWNDNTVYYLLTFNLLMFSLVEGGTTVINNITLPFNFVLPKETTNRWVSETIDLSPNTSISFRARVTIGGTSVTLSEPLVVIRVYDTNGSVITKSLPTPLGQYFNKNITTSDKTVRVFTQHVNQVSVNNFVANIH